MPEIAVHGAPRGMTLVIERARRRFDAGGSAHRQHEAVAASFGSAAALVQGAANCRRREAKS